MDQPPPTVQNLLHDVSSIMKHDKAQDYHQNVISNRAVAVAHLIVESRNIKKNYSYNEKYTAIYANICLSKRIYFVCFAPVVTPSPL